MDSKSIPRYENGKPRRNAVVKYDDWGFCPRRANRGFLEDEVKKDIPQWAKDVILEELALRDAEAKGENFTSKKPWRWNPRIA